MSFHNFLKGQKYFYKENLETGGLVVETLYHGQLVVPILILPIYHFEGLWKMKYMLKK